MTPFRVRCETCKTALKVRDEGFIGEVHACPKCGSMVQILPPQPSDEPESIDDSRAVTTAVLGSTLESLPEDVAAGTTAEAVSGAADETPPEPTQATAEHPTSVAATTKTSGPSWLVLAGGAGVMFAGGIGLSAWLFGSNPEPSLATTPAQGSIVGKADTDTQAQPRIAEVDDEPVITADFESPSATETPEVDPLPDESLPEIEQAKIASGETEGQELTEAGLEPQPLKAQPEEPTRLASLPNEATTPTPSEPLAFAAPPSFDPLDFDPATIELVLTRGASAAEAGAEPDTIEPPREQLQEKPPEAKLDRQLDQQLAAVGRREAVCVERGPSADVRNRPPSTPAETLLAVVVPQIDLKKMPLAEAADFFTSLSGAPVTLSPRSLTRAGVDGRVTVDFTASNETLSGILAEGLAKRRLEIESRGAHIVAVRKGHDVPKATVHRLSDLADPSTEALAELLRTVGPDAARDAVLSAEGELSLDARRGEHFDLLIFTERLRAARGVALKTKYPRALAERAPALAGLWPPLTRRTTFSFVTPTPLQEVIDHIERVTGCTVLVDWVSLADGAGLGPNSTLIAATTNRPWIEALDGLLTPLGLGWAPVDGQTIWIASEAQITAEPPTDFYRTTPRLAKAAIERLSRENPTARAIYDTPSGRLIVSGDAAAHLGTWRAIGEAGTH